MVYPEVLFPPNFIIKEAWQKYLASPSIMTYPCLNLCRCKGQKGEDDAECKFYQKAYRSICPGKSHPPEMPPS